MYPGGFNLLFAGRMLSMAPPDVASSARRSLLRYYKSERSPQAPKFGIKLFVYDFFLTVCEIMKLQLFWTKLKAVITNRARSIIGKKRGLIGRIRREMYRQGSEFCIELH